MKVHTLHVWGYTEDPEGAAAAVNALKDAAMKLNAHLNGKPWLVGGRLTLADIVVFNSLLAPFSFAFDAGFRKAMPHVCAWFEKMSKLPFVSRIAGIIRPMGTSPAKAPAAAGVKQQKGGKQEQPKKEAKKPKADQKGGKDADEDENFDPFGGTTEEDAVSTNSIE